MSTTGVVRQNSVPAIGEGAETSLTLNRRGDLRIADQVVQWGLEGRLFTARIGGDAVTPTSFGETAYDEDQPQFVVRVPSGATIVPVRLEVVFQDSAGTDTHIIWSTTSNDIGDGTSTALTIGKLRTDAPRASLVTANSLYTANSSALSDETIFARFVYPFADAVTGPAKRWVWDIRESSAVPVLVGAASLIGRALATSTAPAGFLIATWAEFESATVLTS